MFGLQAKTRLITGGGLALLLAGAAVTVTAPAATAAGSGTECPTARLCFYFNSDFAGARADFTYSDAGLDNELFTDGPAYRNGWGVVVGNNAASVRNRTGRWVTLFDGRDCNWDTKWVGIGNASFNLAEFGLKNQVSSILIDGSGCVNRDQSNE